MRGAALCALLWLLVASQGTAQQLAFPTAEGFGRFSQGGRGGRAYLINSLSSATGTGGSCTAGGCSGGTITFRDCLLDRFGVGARTCIFRVGGIIDWACESCYAEVPPFLTIAGQTAPGDGIMIKSMQLEFRNTHHVIARHLRVRPSESAPGSKTDPFNSTGGIEVFGPTTETHDIIVDHYSTGWTQDDTTGGSTSYNVTYQWGLVSEGLNFADPSKVAVWTPESFVPGNGAVSFLHNYWANYSYRAPLFGGGDGQLVNNVLYNIHDYGAYLYPAYQREGRLELVNNYLKPGPDSLSNAPRILTLGCGFDGAVNCTHAANSRIYLSGNLHTVLRPTLAGSETAMLVEYGSPTIPVASSPFGFPTIASQTPAAQALTDVLAKAGAYAVAGGTATVRRDSIDQRSITDFTANTGRQDAPNVGVYGGFPTYASGTPYTDTDGDGMSDAWETANGLNPANAADGPASAANGYSNLENFLNELAGDTPATPTEPDLTSNLVAYYRFDGTTADSATADGAQNGTLINGATFTSHAQGGRALQLDGISQFVEVADHASLDLTTAQTVAAWVFPSSALTTFAAVAVKNYTYFLYGSSAGFCGAGGVAGGVADNNHACQATPLAANTWTHLAMTYDGATVRLYRNGLEVATFATTVVPGVTAGTLTIGASQFGEYFPGRLDEVRLYSRALAAIDVQALHALTFPKRRPPKSQGGGTQR